MDKQELSTFLTEEELLLEFGGAEGEVARHLLALRQPPNDVLEQQVAAISAAPSMTMDELSDAAPRTGTGWRSAFSALSSQGLRFAAILLLALGVWALFRVSLAPALQTASEMAEQAPATSPEALARALVLQHGGEEALSGFQVLAEEPLGTGRVLLFTFQAQDERAFSMPLVLLYAEQGLEGWVWRDGHDLSSAVHDLSTSMTVFTASSGESWVPLGEGYVFYGAARQPGVARVEVVGSDGERWVADLAGAQGVGGFLFVQEATGSPPAPPVAVRAYDANDQELLLALPSRATPTAEVVPATAVLDATTVPRETPEPSASRTPELPIERTPTPWVTMTPRAPAPPPTMVATVRPPSGWTPTPWLPATMTPWEPPTGPATPPPTVTPWTSATPWDDIGEPATPPPTPWDPPTPPPDWPTPTPWDGPGGPPTPPGLTPPPEWPTPTPWVRETPPPEWPTPTPWVRETPPPEWPTPTPWVRETPPPDLTPWPPTVTPTPWVRETPPPEWPTPTPWVRETPPPTPETPPEPWPGETPTPWVSPLPWPTPYPTETPIP